MNSSTKLFACALIVAQLVGTIQGGVYDYTDKWVSSDKTKPFPENSVLGGYNSYGYENYVGRTVASSSILSARVRAETGYRDSSRSASAKVFPSPIGNFRAATELRQY